MQDVQKTIPKRLFTIMGVADGFVLGAILHYFLWNPNSPSMVESLLVGVGCGIVFGIVGYIIDQKRAAPVPRIEVD